MTKKEAIKRLDYVLQYLKGKNVYLSHSQVLNDLKKNKFIIEDYELIILLDRLINDGLVIEQKDGNNDPTTNRYLISYHGLLFKSYARKSWLNFVHAVIKHVQAFLLVAGTVFAAVFAFIETYHHSHWHFLHFLHQI